MNGQEVAPPARSADGSAQPARRAFILIAALFCAIFLTHPARASLSSVELATVGVAPPAGAALPHGLTFQDSSGRKVALDDLTTQRPAILVLADYRCRELCGPILSIVAASLGGTGLVAGQDYDLIVVGFNPQATSADAASMKAAQLDGTAGVAEAAHVLTGSPETVVSVERSLNYHAAYDAESRRFAHPSNVFVLTPDGTLSALLSGLVLDPARLRLALVQAGQGRIGSLTDRLHLFCYGLDPATGVANRAVQSILFGGGLLTIGGLALFFVRVKSHRTGGGRSA